MDPLQQAAARGAAFLDARCPAWWQEVCPEALNTANCLLCVLGQKYGEFWAAAARLHLSNEGLRELGFLMPQECLTSEALYRATVARLNDAWRAEISKRNEGSCAPRRVREACGIVVVRRWAGSPFDRPAVQLEDGSSYWFPPRPDGRGWGIDPGQSVRIRYAEGDPFCEIIEP